MPQSRIYYGQQSDQWKTGNSNPTATDGAQGDFFLNVTTREVFEKISASVWTSRGYISAGPNDLQWREGTVGPVGATGNIGDFFLRTDTGEVFSKVGATSWVSRGFIPASPVTQASGVWYLQSTTPSGWNSGDFWINSSSGVVQQRQGASTPAVGLFPRASYLTGAGDNVLVGASAGGAGSSQSVSIGTEAGRSSTSFVNTVALGNYALSTPGTASVARSVAIGDGAARYNGNWVENVAVGAEAMGFSPSISDVNGAVAIGYRAYRRPGSLEQYCIAIGQEAKQNNTASGVRSIALGYQAGVQGLRDDEIAIGAFALQRGGTSGTDNIGIGFASVGGNLGSLNGSNNIGLGRTALGGVSTGSNNVSIGYQTGLNINTGASNTILGASAGNGTNYSNITAIGFQAMQQARTGQSQTTAVGYRAGRNGAGIADTFVGFNCGAYTNTSQTGNNNTGVGINALGGSGGGNVLTSGQSNVGVGVAALGTLTTGSNNVALGSSAMGSAQAQGSSIAIGSNAFSCDNYAATGSGGAIAIGQNALAGGQPSGGTGDIAIGTSAGRYVSGQAAANGSNVHVGHSSGGGFGPTLTTGFQNTGFGNFTNGNLTTGSNNAAFGGFALRNVAGGSQNAALGQFALQNVAGGSGNVGVGYQAGLGTTSASDAIAIGRVALANNNGSSQVAIGKGALNATTGGFGNVAIGHQAAEQGSGATMQESVYIGINCYRAGGSFWNTAVGAYAMQSATAGFSTCVGYKAGEVLQSANTCIGFEAGRLNAGSSGSDANVYLGGGAGVSGTAHTSGTRNTFLGYDAGGTAAAQDNAIAVGFAAKASANQITIGTTTQTALRIPRFTAAGTLTTDASGNITASSDPRMKNHVSWMDNALERCKEIRGALFQWKPESGMDPVGIYPGYYADAVARALPEAVQVDYRDGMRSVQDRGILALAITAINELNAKFEALKSQLAPA